MTRYIFDTDHLSLWLEGHPLVRSRLSHPSSEVSVTIITVQELFNGWTSRINDPKQADRLVHLYTKLWLVVELLRDIPVLNFDAAAEAQYQRLLQTQPRLRKQRIQKDVRIAAIALSTDSVLATRNHKDFSQVPNLAIEDWTGESA
jgi:tRNA(fMet)-specific endonuclease VapC